MTINLPVIVIDEAATIDRLVRAHQAAELIGQAGEARRTAARLEDVGCTGAAADCRLLADDLDAQADALTNRGDQS